MSKVISIMMLVASTAGAQYPPKTLTNLKALPAGISVDSLLEVMAGFTRALGVRCTYCHAGRDAQPLDSIDFASDARLAKEKARVMLRMVQAINGEHLTRLATRRTPAASVGCFTCHHGVAVPQTLQQVVLGAYAAGGIDSATASYRTLRTRYYGRAAYDFGEVALVDVANSVRSSGALADALRLYQLNVEMVPTSTFALRSLAGGSLAMGDTTAAIASYERALAINPSDAQSSVALTRLRRR
ncbi:MAG TPA: c-type cytochrome [Gemmatimonadaceae bacterium]|nr:c-type cytochrome [Gemmatimonadaceae bacterium]